MRTFLVSLAIGWSLASAAIAGDACKAPAACEAVQTCGNEHHCARCGCDCACEKHCRLVCEMKEISKTVWAVNCTDMCAPLPRCCHECCGAGEATEANACEVGCSNSGGKRCDPCAAEESKCFIPPKCGKVREVKKLVKKEVVCKVPSYKCVVVYCCPKCGQTTAPVCAR